MFTNKDGSDFYKGTVFGKNNEILMTVKDADNHFYSYWASEVTDPSATMQSYRLVEYKKDLAALVENDKMLNRNDIKEVTMTTDANSAIIGLLRNGDTEAGAPVTGAITVTSGGGTGGSDTFVKISNGTVNQTFATGSKVEAIGTPEATAGIKINGQEYTIKSGSVVSVAKDASNKTTTITVDGKATTITDTDTTYTAGDGIEINGGNAISVSKNLTGMQSIKGAGAGSISFDGANVKVNNTTFSKNSVVVGVAGDGKHPVRINGESGEILGLGNDTITYTTFAQTDGKAATEKQLKQVMDEGWNFTTDSGAKTTVTVGEAGNEVKFNGDSANIEVTNNGKDIKVALKNDLTVDSVKAGDFFMDKNQGVGYADKAYITSSGLNANNQKITGVADGTNDTDAVNFGQLKETNTKVENLKVEAGKHTTLVAGENVQLNQENTDKGLQYTINAKDTTYAAGNGITISGANNEISVKVKAGENNLQVTDAGLELKKDLTVDSVKAGSSFMSATGIGYGDKAYITSSGLNANNQKITGVAAGNADTDAVNVGQLKTVSEVANQGWKLSTNGDAASKVAPGEIVDFSGDKNISVSHNGTKVKVELNDELEDIKSISNGDSRINLNADSISISNGNKSFAITNSGIGMSYITADYSAKSIMLGENGTTISGGLNVAGSKITGVAAGTIAAGSTDAVNGSQLNDIKNSINTDISNKTFGLKDDKGSEVTSTLGNTVQVKGADGITSTVKDGALEIGLKLQEGSNLVVNSNGLALNTALTGIQSINGTGAGSISFADGGNVKVNDVTIEKGGKITGVAAGTTEKDAVNFGQLDATNKKVDNLTTEVGKGWVVATENGTATKVGAGDTVKFSGADNNIKVSNDGTNVKVELNKDLTVDSVKAGDFFMDKTQGVGYDGKAYITSSGLNANNQKITGVAAGTIAAGSTDAVNGSQLYDVKNSINTDISNKTFGLEDDKGNKATSTLGNTVQVKGADGITSTVKDGALEIGLKLQDNSNLVVNSNGLALNTALTGIQSINGAGGTINLAGSAITINETTFNKDGRIQNVAAGTETKDAVNVGQLDATNKKVDNLTTKVGKGWVVATENGTATKVGAGDTVKFSGADNNIKVSNDGTNVKVELNKDLTVDSVKAGDFFMDKNEGVGYKGKAYITSSGLNANGQTITNVKAGEAETDAVNVGQLNAVKAEASKKTTLSNGKNTTVTSVTTDGQTDYKVNVAGDLKDITSVANGASEIKLNADSIIIANTNKTFAITNSGIGMSYVASDYSTKAIMLGENGTTISGGLNVAGSKITGVAAGTAATDAVNVGQLNALKETANKGWKLKTNNGNVSDVKPGDEVEFDGDDNIKVSNAGNKVSFKLNNKLTGIESIAGVGGGSISFSGGNVTINNNVTFGSNGQIHNVTAGTASTDAVNVGQLNAAVQAGNTDTHIKPGEYGVGADNKVNMDVVDKTGTKINTVTITDVAKASDLGNVNNINNDLKNSNGTTTVVDAVNNLNQKLDNKVGDLQYSKVDKGDIADGDSTTTAIGKLDQKLNDVAATAAKQHTTVSGSGNIVVEDPTINADGGKNYNVKLADDINVNSVTANTFKADQTVMNKDGLKVGEKVSVTENAVTAGKTSISDDGVKVGDKTYISADGLNANDQKVTNVSDGKVEKDSKDAINGGQLHQAKADINNRIDGVENQVISNTNCINKLGSRVNKVGAGAAALAALHPMDFDPDDKLTFSAGYGNYAGENAAAIGAYYRPDEKVMFSVAGTVGNGENMVNAGVSFALDRTNHVSNSRTALAREVIDLRGQLAVMGAKMEKAFGMLDETKTKLFPDVPANHWAYEYIAKLAGNGYIEGYPDGNFGGDRLMTRYEFAAMLYRAIENGAALEEKIIKEFEPELGRIRVDRISGEDGDRDKIERVRVNDTKGERDHYGNKLVK